MPEKRIAVITARADSSEQKTVLLGISQAAFAANADVEVFTNIYNHWVNDELLNFENTVYDLAAPEIFDGIIITAEAFMDLSALSGLVRKIKKSSVPAVVIDGEIEGLKSVLSDDEADMEFIAEHLLTVHGFTDIDILTGLKDNPVSRKRVNGCKRAFEKHGAKFDADKVFYGDFWTSSGKELAGKYISGELPMPQAVICTSDYMAYGLCDTLTEAGISVPEKITVMGYDYNDDRIYHYPLLSTYRRNRRKMGIEAVNILLKGNYAEEEDERFVRGNTCACGANPKQTSDEILAARIGQYHTATNSVAQLSSRLTLCRTLAEYNGVLSDFFYLIYGAERLYMCIDREWSSEAMAGSEYICCKIKSETASVLSAKLLKNELMTSLDGDREKPRLSYYLPLVFQKKCFGYAVLVYDHPQCYDISLRDFIKTAVNSLEFLRMKNDIHYLSQCRRESSLYDALTGFYNLSEFKRIVRMTAESGTLNLLAIRILFAADGEYILGEGCRSDVIAAAAATIKKLCVNHELCCRTDNGFVVMYAGEYFYDKLKSAIQCELAGKISEPQIIISYSDEECAKSKNAVESVLDGAEKKCEFLFREVERRRKLPHYEMLLNLRNEIVISPHKAYSIDKASRRFCISEGHFRAIYKKCFGISYVNDCINARLTLAKYLLCTSSMSIYAIAMKCGYADEKYFSRQFKESTGCTPLKYRNNYCHIMGS